MHCPVLYCTALHCTVKYTIHTLFRCVKGVARSGERPPMNVTENSTLLYQFKILKIKIKNAKNNKFLNSFKL